VKRTEPAGQANARDNLFSAHLLFWGICIRPRSNEVARTDVFYLNSGLLHNIEAVSG